MFRQSSFVLCSLLIGLLGVMGCGDDDGVVETGCCVALSGTDQTVCDPLEAFGPDRCNMVNGGSSCQWATTALCGGSATDAGEGSDAGAAGDAETREDGGETGDAALPDGALPREDGGGVEDGGVVEGDASLPDGALPREDAGMVSDGCCQALPGEDQAVCDPLPTIGRCNMINGGASCAWSDIPECTSAPISCCVANAAGDQSACDAIARLGEEDCDAVDTCSWSESAECAAPPTTCCSGRGGTPSRFCDMIGTDMSTCERAECEWSDHPSCAAPPACCMGADARCESALTQPLCDRFGCRWSREPMCSDTEGCCVGDLRTCGRRTMELCADLTGTCHWTTDLSMCLAAEF